MSVVEGIPAPYYVTCLHEEGRSYYNNKNHAFELRVNGIDRSFFVHLEYLTSQSTFFRDNCTDVKEGDLVVIDVPSPETFEPIIEYLYFGNGDKWYDTMTIDNYGDVYHNVEYLGLDDNARSICLAFYQANQSSLEA
ncbi:unnamed protein product [Rhizophagus irregularis]|uniref:BTB domain-containing protein n=1 Tax=Rhizophagus irregularis TaxID=588596 RepID=A0A2I1GYG4_9GLOM|nr:hypothetical protein RhiirA4_494380 [Rhizophagus irregularis]PKY52271.1 hypothetical protein RhiirA4_547068 [Rhizophagus irregularis]CAB4443858.1 unnamed protein product [Rhizophagus irregularis]CAB4443919.1 unnamed protein product [Rhizophagus irregularis]